MNKPSHHRRPRSNTNSGGRNQGHKRSNNNNGRRGQANRGNKPINKNNVLQQIEKYKNQAKDAMQTGDRCLGENYLQHADHFQRILNDLNQPSQQSSHNMEKPKPVADDTTNNSDDSNKAPSETPKVSEVKVVEAEQKPEVKAEAKAEVKPEVKAEKPARKPRAPRKPKGEVKDQPQKADETKADEAKPEEKAAKTKEGEAA